MTLIPERWFKGGHPALFDTLGEYASWFLDPAQAPLERYTDPGLAVVLVAGRLGGATAGLPGYFLPVRWKRGLAHSVLLPPAIVKTAQEVLNALELPANAWGLTPFSDEVDGIDVSELPLDGGSGFASLAAALVTARAEVRSTPGVFASAGWDGRHLCAVGAIEQKVELLRGASFPSPTLFFHETNLAASLDADARLPGSDLTIGSLPQVSGRVALEAQLLPLLKAMAAPPTLVAGSPLDDRIRYYNTAPALHDPADKDAYYDAEIRQELGRLLRERFGFQVGGTFVLNYNPGNPSFTRLMLDLAGPEHVVVLRQVERDPKKDGEQLAEARARLARWGKDEAQYRLVDLDPDWDRVRILGALEAAMEWLRERGVTRYVDGVNGTSFLKAASFVIARRRGAVPVAIEQVFTGPRLSPKLAEARVQHFDFVLAEPV